MVKKTVKYVDFNGVENEETFYFNLSKAELTMLELNKKGGMSTYIKEAVESGNNAAIVETFAELLVESYGVKSEDGKHFRKSEALKADFKSSAAYSELFMEMATNPGAAEAFAKALIQ